AEVPSLAAAGWVPASAMPAPLLLARAPSHQQPPDPLGGKKNESDENQPEEQGPCLGVGRELMFKQEKEGSAQNWSDQRAGTADDHHDQHLARQQPEQKLSVGKAGERRIERAR